MLILHFVTEDSAESFLHARTVELVAKSAEESVMNMGLPPTVTLAGALKNGQAGLFETDGRGLEATITDTTYSDEDVAALLGLRNTGDMIPATIREKVQSVDYFLEPDGTS